VSPSVSPSASPSATPSATPSIVPSASPSAMPSAAPSYTATVSPSVTPSASPSAMPSYTVTSTPSNAPTAAIDLGDCIDFAIMAGTAVSFGGVLSTVAVGSVGVAPGTAITGLYTVSSGSVEADTAAAISCAASMMTAYNTAAGTTCTNTSAPQDLGGLTLSAGVYCNSGGSFGISADTLTLSGSATDVWIFQAATSMTTAASTSIVLSGGALAENVFWQLGTTLTTGASSSFVGTVLSGTSITMGSTSTLNGRAMAQAAVSLTSGNTVTSFVAGYSDAPSTSPTSGAGTSSTGSSSASSSLSGGNIAAIVIMSVVGLLGLAAAVYFGLAAQQGDMSASSKKSGDHSAIEGLEAV